MSGSGDMETGKGGADLGYDMTGKLLTILRAFPAREPTKKRFVTEMINWSSKVGEYPLGDPELHHVAGSIFTEGSIFAYFTMKRLIQLIFLNRMRTL